MTALRSENTKLKSRIHSLEKEKKKHNAVIHGLQESDNENCVKSVQDTVSLLNIAIKDSAIEDAFRAGKIIANKRGENAAQPKSRAIIFKVKTFELKILIMNAVANLRKEKVIKNILGDTRLSYDYTIEERDTYRKLVAFLEILKTDNPGVKAFIRYDKIVCGNKTYKLNETGGDIEEINN